MQRRSFIRLAGGGVIAVATAATVSGCSDAYPTQALEAWRGPGPQADLGHLLVDCGDRIEELVTHGSVTSRQPQQRKAEQ